MIVHENGRLNSQLDADRFEYLKVHKHSQRDNPAVWKYVRNVGKNKVVVDRSMKQIRLTTRYPLSWRADMFKISQEEFMKHYREVQGIIHKEYETINQLVLS